ncbi:MAG: hypothetical protein R2867_16480 [Caldilineaceae bacterium]
MEQFETPERISLERFEDLVEEAIESIPDALWENIDNLAVVVEEWPRGSNRPGLVCAATAYFSVYMKACR